MQRLIAVKRRLKDARSPASVCRLSIVHDAISSAVPPTQKPRFRSTHAYLLWSDLFKIFGIIIPPPPIQMLVTSCFKYSKHDGIALCRCSACFELYLRPQCPMRQQRLTCMPVNFENWRRYVAVTVVEYKYDDCTQLCDLRQTFIRVDGLVLFLVNARTNVALILA